MDDWRSTLGYYSLTWGNLVTWRSKKQIMVARSSTKVELRAIAHAICKILWLKMILKELKVMVKESMEVYCDNKATINISHSPVHHDRTQHVEVDRRLFKEKIDKGVVCITYIPTTK